MNISKKLSLLPLISLLAFTTSTTVRAVCPIIRPVPEGFYIPVNPQIGENLWQMTDRIATSLDSVGPTIVQSSFELNDLAYTSSLCCPCTCFITQADVPNYMITQPGVYCVAEPITLGSAFGAPIISVAGVEDVVIDFRGNKISAIFTSVVSIVASHRVVIRNAIIDVQGLNAIVVDSLSSAIIIENCIIRNTSGFGIRCLGASNNILIENCVVSETFGPAFSIEDGTSEVTLRNCRSVGTPTSLGVVAFNVNNECFNITFDSCYAYRSGGNGFFADASSSAVILNNCQANFNGSIGIAINASASSMKGCVACGNASDGFNINATALANRRIEVLSSVAYNNVGVGIRNGVVADSHVFNNISALNTGGNYVNVIALIAPGAVTTSTGYWSNITG